MFKCDTPRSAVRSPLLKPQPCSRACVGSITAFNTRTLVGHTVPSNGGVCIVIAWLTECEKTEVQAFVLVSAFTNRHLRLLPDRLRVVRFHPKHRDGVVPQVAKIPPCGTSCTLSIARRRIETHTAPALGGYFGIPAANHAPGTPVDALRIRSVGLMQGAGGAGVSGPLISKSPFGSSGTAGE